MIIQTAYCDNCGASYMWQASGRWALETPEEYNDREHCPECKKAIIDALAPIEKKSMIKWIKTDLVDLETLKRWESEMLEERKVYTGGFPYIRRAFPSLFNTETGEHSKDIHIQGRKDHKDKFFHCTYWEKESEPMTITTKVRMDMDDNILKYETD